MLVVDPDGVSSGPNPRDRAAAFLAWLLDAYDTGRQIAPISEGNPDFDTDSAYRVTHEITTPREARGVRRVGRKIGFTNRTIWPIYGVSGPIWGPVWDTTLHEIGDGLFILSCLVIPCLWPSKPVGCLKTLPNYRA